MVEVGASGKMNNTYRGDLEISRTFFLPELKSVRQTIQPFVFAPSLDQWWIIQQ